MHYLGIGMHPPVPTHNASVYHMEYGGTATPQKRRASEDVAGEAKMRSSVKTEIEGNPHSAAPAQQSESPIHQESQSASGNSGESGALKQEGESSDPANSTSGASHPESSHTAPKAEEDAEEPENTTSEEHAKALAREAPESSGPYIDLDSKEVLDSTGKNLMRVEDHSVIVPRRAPQLKFYGKKTGLAYDVRMRYHSRPIADPISYIDPHPEDPRRTFRIYRAIAEAGLIEDETLQGAEQIGDLMRKLPTRQASEEELRLVHTQEMIDFIRSTAGMRLEELQHEIDRGDSIYLNNDSNEAARLSAGGAIEACKGVVEGTVKNAIAVIRPPGHHAEPGNPAGFCLFANVAIASEVMLQKYPETVRKILIFDWDVHHGNGTQRAFFEDDRVLYISTHRYDNGTFYPGTTFAGADVVGAGKGKGYSVNIPWKCGGMGDGDYLTAFHQIVMPIAAEFDPDLVIVSAGFDAADGDPIGGCHVSPQGYQHMLANLMTLAEGKVVVALEGGYNLDSISRSALAITKTLLGDPPGKPTGSLASNPALEVFAEVKAVQSQYWKSVGPPTIKFEPEIEQYNHQQQLLSEKAEHAREDDEAGNRASSVATNGGAESSDRDATPTPSNANGGADANASSAGAASATSTGTGSNAANTGSGADNEEVDLDLEEKSKPRIHVLRSLMDIVRSNESAQLSTLHSFAKLPLLRAGNIDSQIMSTPNIYNAEKIILLFHGISLIWAHRDPITGRIRPDESVVANPCAKYIEWALSKGYGVVDIFVTPLETTAPAKLVNTICDNAIRFFKAQHISIIGAGQAYGYAVQTAAHRCLKDNLKSIVCFVGSEDTLRQFPSTSDEAAVRKFHDKSLVFTVNNHNTWKQRYVRKKCGRLIRCESENLYALMREKFAESTEWIEAAEEDDDEEDEDDEEDDSE